MRARQWFSPILVVALVLATTLLVHPARADATATLSSPLATWLATASEGASFRTIATFRTYDGMSKIDTLGVGATKLSKLPIAFATLTAAQLRQVAAWPEARSLWHDNQNTIYLDQSVPLTKADQVWAGNGLKRGYTGAGVGVAVIDTGVDGLHPDLPAGTKVEAYVVAGDPFERQPMTFTPTVTGDNYGHGTHVSSIVGGLGLASGGTMKPGSRTGMAPGAKIYSFKTDVGVFLLDSWILGSFDWILAHPEKGIRVSSNSWGSGDGTDYLPDDPINVTTKALYDADITVVFAAGNGGGPNTLNQFATSPWVISAAAGTVPAKDVSNPSGPIKLASFSSRGRIGGPWDRRAAQRTNSGIYRPTLTAPGQDIAAARSSQGLVLADGVDANNPFYTFASGTSMATPHVAGAVALMLEARPGLHPQNAIDVLEGTAANLPSYEIFEVGLGHLDALAAVKAAEKGKIHFPPAINGKTPQFTLTSAATFSGTVASGTWLIRECPDSTGLLSQHHFTIGTGVDAVFAEIEWADENQLIYLVLYDPSCQEAAVSAALLDIGSVRHRAVIVTSPAAGTWTVAIYGRINIPTQYAGSFQTYVKH